MAKHMKVGEKVQAIDELGRWTDGKVVSFDETGIFVKFPGWGDEFNSHVAWSDVRPKLPPLEEQQRRNCILEEKRSRNQRVTGSAAAHTTLCRGDIIWVKDVPQTVHTIDPFNCLVVLEDGQIVPFSEVQEQPKCSTSPQKRHNAVKRPRLTQTDGESRQSKSGDAEATVIIQDVALDISVPHETSAIYKSHDVSCGTVYTCKMAESGLLLAVGHIDLFTKVVTGWVVHNDIIDRMCKIQLPIEKLLPCAQPKLCINDRKMLGRCQDNQFNQTMINMEENNYRKEMRVSQIVTILRRETRASLIRRHKSHSFSLGLYVPDVDSEFLGITPRSRIVRHSYRNNNLEELDQKIGAKWDITVAENITMFVTSLSIKLTKDGSVSVQIQIGQFMGHMSADVDCRITLAAHIAELSLLPPPPEDTSIEGSLYM